MKTSSKIITLLLLGTGVLCAPLAARAEGSLFDRSTARTVGPDLQRILGPKSSGIRYDSRMIRAAQIAAQRAHKHSTSRCWRYVKDALVDAQVVSSRPGTAYAKQAADELCKKYGFMRLKVNDPFQAPVGSVLVYGGRGAGHVELRTTQGFVSDFLSQTPSTRPLIGVYVKRS